MIAVSVWKEIAEVLKPRLFNVAVARHYEGSYLLFYLFIFPLSFLMCFSSPFYSGLVTRNMKLMDKDMLAILGDQGLEKSEEIPKKADEGENNNEGKKKKGKGKGEEGEKMSKETRRMKNKKSKEISMTKEEVFLFLFP